MTRTLKNRLWMIAQVCYFISIGYCADSSYLSPDKTKKAYLYNGNWWVLDLSDKRRYQVENFWGFRNGIRVFKFCGWSPDSKYLLFFHPCIPGDVQYGSTIVVAYYRGTCWQFVAGPLSRLIDMENGTSFIDPNLSKKYFPRWKGSTKRYWISYFKRYSKKYDFYYQSKTLSLGQFPALRYADSLKAMVPKLKQKSLQKKEKWIAERAVSDKVTIQFCDIVDDMILMALEKPYGSQELRGSRVLQMPDSQRVFIRVCISIETMGLGEITYLYYNIAGKKVPLEFPED